MGYTKTKTMVTIIQRIGNRREVVERRVYVNEHLQEFVTVNRCRIPLEHYEIDRHYEVIRY